MNYKLSISTFLFGLLVLTSCQESKENKAYLDKGMSITDSTGMALVGQLTKAMQEGGVPHAIEYCNLEAEPITARQSKKYGVKISRVAYNNRNEKNHVNEDEEALLVNWENDLKRDEPLKPYLLIVDKKKVFYRPITMKPMCMSCHGEVGVNITNENYDIIKKYYPNDKAVGFAENGLRGAWKVEF